MSWVKKVGHLDGGRDERDRYERAGGGGMKRVDGVKSEKASLTVTGVCALPEDGWSKLIAI